ncbi:unnamed protein product [Cylicocyclus nassatus]|uniref:Uncharacterized protein n=1 Tax=Cylicocyclus nassatus TaxID=53992 RepID=A0AA36H3E2_CYLNA|nr:unnamed protein product [Cylicocyclus nassatus]
MEMPKTKPLEREEFGYTKAKGNIYGLPPSTSEVEAGKVCPPENLREECRRGGGGMPFSTQFPAPHHVGIRAFGDHPNILNNYNHAGTDGWAEEEEQETGEREMSTQDRILYCAMHVQDFGLSEAQIKWNEKLMKVLYGRATPITYNGHFAPFNNKVLEAYDNKRYLYCCQCNTELTKEQTACENQSCSIFESGLKLHAYTQLK